MHAADAGDLIAIQRRGLPKVEDFRCLDEHSMWLLTFMITQLQM